MSRRSRRSKSVAGGAVAAKPSRRARRGGVEHRVDTGKSRNFFSGWLWLWRPLVVFLLIGAMVAFWIPLPRELDERLVEKDTLFDNRGLLVISLPHYEPRRFYPIPIEDMGTWLPEMVVALEDHRFFEHHGVDVITLGGSVLRNLRAGRRVSGGSTITQQVIKLAERKFEERTIPRKIYEMLAAMRLERRWEKKHILEEYLNRLPFGNGLLGVEAASIFYFGKGTSALNQREAIFLAGLPQAPSRYNPWRNPENAKQRYHRCLDRLEELGILTRELADEYFYDVPVVRPEPADWGGLEVRMARLVREPEPKLSDSKR